MSSNTVPIYIYLLYELLILSSRQLHLRTYFGFIKNSNTIFKLVTKFEITIAFLANGTVDGINSCHSFPITTLLKCFSIYRYIFYSE